jgi:type I restriction enzyme, S subunit
MAGDILPVDWPLVKLGDLGEVNRGRSRHRPRYAEHLYGGPYPFIQTGDIKASGGRIGTYHQTYSEAGLAQSRLWPAGTMCITIAANIAETGILTFDACFPDSVVGFIPDGEKCDVYFIEYTFRYLRDQIQNEASGSVQDNINLATLDRLRFPLPPLPEQRAIAHILGTLDDKIELNRRMNETLEAMARALFKSWFVDFDPVRAKMDGRQPEGMDKATADLFPDSFEDSPLGKIPKGWEVVSVQEIADRVAMGPFGSSITRDNFVETGVPVIRGNNLTDGFNESDFVYLTPGKADELRNANAFPGDLVFTHRGTLGQVGLIPDTATHCRYVVSQSQMLVSVNCSLTSAKLLYQFFRTSAGQQALLANTSQTGVPAIARPTTSLKAIRLVLPPKLIADRYDGVTQAIDQRRAWNVSESRNLAALRDALLPKLLSGEIRVPEVERGVGEVV